MTADDVLAAATAGDTDRARALAVFDRLDALQLAGRLDAVLDELRGRDVPSIVAELLPYARAQARRPLIIGHRGDPTSFVENTLPGITSAFRQGADAVELDVTLVRDGDGFEVICRHDPDAGGLSISGLYALVRNLGLEPRVYADDLFLARPTTPPIWRQALRRPSYELPLATYRAAYGYAEVKSWPMSARRLEAEIPTLGQVAALVADGWREKLLFLDTKLPPARPDLVAAMAARISGAVATYDLDPGRIIVGNSDAAILGGLRDALGPRYRYTLDEMLVGPFATAEGASPHGKARSFGTDLCDVGHVFWGSDAELLKVVERELAELCRDGRELVVWTINDELVFRKLLGIGGRSGAAIAMVITDRPVPFGARLDRLGLTR